jgi:hypothetical protein
LVGVEVRQKEEGGCGGLIGNPSILQNDSGILSYIQEYHLTPPSSKPYVFAGWKTPDMNPSQYGAEIMRIFGNKASSSSFLLARDVNLES